MKKLQKTVDGKVAKALERIGAEYSLVVISGASSGIGEALAEMFVCGARNVCVCNLSRTESPIESENFVNIACDVSELSQIDRAYEKISELRKARSLDGGKVLLINNSGFGAYGLFPEPNAAHNCDMIDVNVRGLTYLCAKFTETLRKSGGGIINVASTAAFQPCPYLSVYAATKAYVLNFSLALDWELRKFGAKCLCLCPGPTGTNFFKRAGFDKRPLKSDFGHTAQEVAEACIIAYVRGKNLKVVGKLNFLQSMFVNIIPRVWIGRFAGMVLSIFRN